MPREFSKLSAQAIRGLPPLHTVFFFPIGTIEDHGPNLPVGLDLFEAEELCRRLAAKLESESPGWIGILMPPTPLSADANTSEIALTVRAAVLRDWLIDWCRSLKRAGFQHFACISGTLGPRQLTAIEEASRKIGRPFGVFRKGQPQLLSVSSAFATRSEILASPFWPDPSEHGAARDTSVALEVCPELVAPEYATSIRIERNPSHLSRALSRFTGRLAHYWGDPTPATREAGQRQLSETISRIWAPLRSVWEGAPPGSTFRSWYSVLPPNRTAFRSWTLLFIFLFVGGLWLYWLYRLLFPTVGV